MALLMDDRFDTTLKNDNMQEFYVTIKGPEDSPYKGGRWKIRVELPDGYPHKSPSIGFVNRIYHPNIDESSGSVCLDVLNQLWTPMYSLPNVFELLIPQLLMYPNESDPLNGDAASLLMRDKAAYEAKVKDYVKRYASEKAVEEAEHNTDDDDEMSSTGGFDSDDDDEEAAGNMDDV